MAHGVALLLEDEPVIALDLEITLTVEGYVVVTLDTCVGALHWLQENEPPIVAVIDVSLKDGRSDSVALELRRRGIPFVVHSGEPADPDNEALSAAVWLSKPSRTDAFLTAVSTALSMS